MLRFPRAALVVILWVGLEWALLEGRDWRLVILGVPARHAGVVISYPANDDNGVVIILRTF